LKDHARLLLVKELLDKIQRKHAARCINTMNKDA